MTSDISRLAPAQTRPALTSPTGRGTSTRRERAYKNCHLWLQNCDTHADDTDLKAEFARAMRQHGVENLAFSGFRGCASLFDTAARPKLATPEMIWQTSTLVFAGDTNG